MRRLTDNVFIGIWRLDHSAMKSSAVKYLINKHVFTILTVALSTGLFILGRDYFAKGQWALLYLLIISLIARLGGVRPALLAALLSFLSWNVFLLPPFMTLAVGDPKDWLSLVVFLFVGVVIGLQTGRMKDRERNALAREQDTALLNRFGAHLVSDIELPDMAEILLTEITHSIGAKCATLYLPDDKGELGPFHLPAGLSCPEDDETDRIVDWAYRNVKAVGMPPNFEELKPGDLEIWPISVSHGQAGAKGARKEIFMPLQSASRVEGVIKVGERLDQEEYNTHATRLIVALVNQSAAFLERQRLRTEAFLADTLKESEKIKSVLISSVSHELKTPLASATATVTNILEADIHMDDAKIRNELETVRYDLDRLNSSISSLVDLSLLETETWIPRMELYEPGEILATMRSKIPARQQSRILWLVPDNLPLIRVDFNQWARALQNLLENALIYSPSQSPVTVGASYTGEATEISIEDEGPGISQDERKLVFNKFFRGESSSLAPSGTGLGMAIAYEIVKYHGGEIRIEDSRPKGTRIVVSLPKSAVVEET